jgi:hypothetical protein
MGMTTTSNDDDDDDSRWHDGTNDGCEGNVDDADDGWRMIASTTNDANDDGPNLPLPNPSPPRPPLPVPLADAMTLEAADLIETTAEDETGGGGNRRKNINERSGEAVYESPVVVGRLLRPPFLPRLLLFSTGSTMGGA